MKKEMEKPFIKVMKLEAMNVIATSPAPQQDGVTIQQLTTAGDNASIGF